MCAGVRFTVDQSVVFHTTYITLPMPLPCFVYVLCMYCAVSLSGGTYMCAEPRGGHKASLVNFQIQDKLRGLFSIPK